MEVPVASQQTLTQQPLNELDDVDIAIINETNSEFKEIVNDLNEIVTMSTDLNINLSEHTEGLDDLEQLQQGTLNTAEESLYEIAEANRKAAASIPLKWAIYTLGVGYIPGLIVENRIKSHVDREIRSHHDSKKFVPYDNVHNCTSCNEEFTAIWRRKHHCRRCGNVFCGSCVEKCEIYYRGVKNMKKHNVCTSCKRKRG
eukprot:TRINITY_DN12401_c0_g1_i1.p1 TRINITY_DN12401_c0_g1~~TRINITY_DN12401_c0_g1_i1.p1  ORF type:complete len:200 (+),score=24.16 TRINITY_DN12401_c0_g1_i1:49-648(+)